MDDAKIQGIIAKARADSAKEQDNMASAQERIAKIHELNASAEHKTTEADLNLVELAMGLENLQLEQFGRAIEIAQQLKQMNEIEQTPAMAG